MASDTDRTGDIPLASPNVSTGSYASSRGKEDSAAAQMFPVARLLDAQKQAFEVQAELDEQKRTHAQLEEGFKAREAALKKKDLELQESLVRFSKFLQENDAKRARANKKAIDERQLFQEKSVECQALDHTVAGLHAQKTEALALLAKYLKYQEYLESVLEVTDMFHQIDDLLARHSTLEQANTDLRQQQWHAADVTETTAIEMQALVKATTDKVLHQNSTISELKKQLDAARRDSHVAASQRSASQAAAADRLRQLGQIKLTSDNLYQRCRQRTGSGASHAPDLDSSGQLTYVGNFISDLAFIVNESKGQQTTKAA